MNFYRSLRQKTENDPRVGAERDLMRKLDDAFARDFAAVRATSRRPFAWLSELEIFRFAPVALALVLVVFIGNQSARTLPHSDIPASAVALVSDSFEASLVDPKSESVEFYDEMEDWMLTASDEEWDLLLEKRG
jgi:hypothetical protein